CPFQHLPNLRISRGVHNYSLIPQGHPQVTRRKNRTRRERWREHQFAVLHTDVSGARPTALGQSPDWVPDLATTAASPRHLRGEPSPNMLLASPILVAARQLLASRDDRCLPA